MAEKKEIEVRLGTSNRIEKENMLITPLYLTLGAQTYTGMIHDRDNNIFSINWSENVPEFVRTKWEEFLDLYKHFKSAIPSL
jgi:hypothetical protein